MDYQKKYMKYKKKYLRLIGKLTGGLKYPPGPPDPSKTISEDDIKFPIDFFRQNPKITDIFKWRHTLDMCKDAAGTGSLNNVISILENSQLFWINDESPLRLNFGQPNSSTSYKTHLEYFEKTILNDVKKNLKSTPWIKNTQSQAQQLKYSYTKSLWDCGRSPKSYIHQNNNPSQPTIVLSTFAGYMDPLEKDSKKTEMSPYPEGRFEYTLDENDMTLLGFEGCTMKVGGQYDKVFNNWDQVGFTFTFETPLLGTITITRPEGLTPQQPNSNIPNPITITITKDGNTYPYPPITINGITVPPFDYITDLVLGNNNIAEALKKIGGNLELKLTYILIKLLGDWGQVIFYFIIKKLNPDESIIMTTCDMVVYCLCITLELECIYSAKNNNFPSDIRQSGSKDLVLYKPIDYSPAQAAFVNFRKKLQEIYIHNQNLAQTIKALNDIYLQYEGSPFEPVEFIDGVVEDIIEINLQFFTEVRKHGIDLKPGDQITPRRLADDYDPYDPALYSTKAKELKHSYECSSIFIFKGKGKRTRNLTVRANRTSYTLAKNQPKPNLKIKMEPSVSCEATDNFRQIFHNYYNTKKSWLTLNGGTKRIMGPTEEQRRKISEMLEEERRKISEMMDQNTKSNEANHNEEERGMKRKSDEYTPAEIDEHILFQTDVDFKQFEEEKIDHNSPEYTLQQVLHENMKLLIDTIQICVLSPDLDLENPNVHEFVPDLSNIEDYEKTEDNNIIILKDWVISIFIYCIHSNFITDFDVSSTENIWTPFQAQDQLEIILDTYFANNETLNKAKAYYDKKVTAYRQTVRGGTIIGGAMDIKEMEKMKDKLRQFNLIEEIYTQRQEEIYRSTGGMLKDEKAQATQDFLYETIIETIKNIKTIFEKFSEDYNDSIEHLGKLLDEVTFLLREYVRSYLEKPGEASEEDIISIYKSLFSENKNKNKTLVELHSMIDGLSDEPNLYNIMNLEIAVYFMLMLQKKELFALENTDLDLAPPRFEDFILEPKGPVDMDI